MKRISVILFVLAGCIPAPVTPVPETTDGGSDAAVNSVKDASDTDLTNTEEPDGAKAPCAKVCANLDKHGCPEGKNANCYPVCVHIQITNLIPFDVVCLGNAKSITEIRNCGAITCIQK